MAPRVGPKSHGPYNVNEGPWEEENSPAQQANGKPKRTLRDVLEEQRALPQVRKRKQPAQIQADGEEQCSGDSESEADSEATEKKTAQPKTFRKRGKFLPLTWSCMDANSVFCDAKAQIRDLLIDKLKGYGVRRWIVAREEHKSGAIHYHAGIEVETKFDIKDLKKSFRFKAQPDKEAHPELKVRVDYTPSCSKDGGDWEGWAHYCMKGSDYIK